MFRVRHHQWALGEASQNCSLDVEVQWVFMQSELFSMVSMSYGFYDFSHQAR